MPKSTAQDSFAGSNNRSQTEIAEIKQHKELASQIFERNRNAKPHFTMGSHKLNYVSENKESMCEPGQVTVDRKSMELHKANQRMHNFKMSFEQGNQFQTDKGTSKPFHLSVAEVKQAN